MVTAFIGIGVHTFHPSPEGPLGRRVQELNREQVAVRESRAPEALTPDDRARLQTLREELNAAHDESREARERWTRSTSIILITFATLVMSVSLVRAGELLVISNGLLLGGVFTMIYGVGWTVATGTSLARFVVMTMALVITLVLGYARFVRGRVRRTDSPDAAGLPDLERRLEALERRLDDAASALGSKR
jgi:hypothetical protein